MERQLVRLRRYYRLFNKNKLLILSGLFILSILKSVLWYALWGVNILSYSSLQDIFLSFADYLMIVVYILVLVIIMGFIPIYKLKGVRKIFAMIGILTASVLFLWLVCSIFRLILPIFGLLAFFTVFLGYYLRNNKNELSLVLFLIVLFFIFQPIEQYSNIKHQISNSHIAHQEQIELNLKNRVYKPPVFSERSAHYDFFSFDYNDIQINTNNGRCYLIGVNSLYFFVFDSKANETLIIPKSECKNIKSKPFGLKNLLFISEK